MKTLEIDLKTLTPYADFNRMIMNVRSLTVVIGKQKWDGAAVLTDPDENGHITMTLEPKRKAKK